MCLPQSTTLHSKSTKQSSHEIPKLQDAKVLEACFPNVRIVELQQVSSGCIPAMPTLALSCHLVQLPLFHGLSFQ